MAGGRLDVRGRALERRPAEELAEVISAALAERQASRGGPTDGSALARVVADARTNSLIVWGSPTDIAEVRGLIGKLDVPASPP